MLNKFLNWFKPSFSCCKCKKKITEWSFSKLSDKGSFWWCKECAVNDPEIQKEISRMEKTARNLRYIP